MKLTNIGYSILAIIIFQFCSARYAHQKPNLDGLTQRNSKVYAKEVAGIQDLIKTIQVTQRIVLKIEVHEEFKKSYLLDDFFAEYGFDIDLSRIDSSILVLPFILNVIPIVWISGQNYSIESMDKDMYNALKTVKEVLKRLYPKISWKGNLIPRQLVENVPQGPLKNPEKECALLFSGGLDSTSAALANLDKNLLLITMRGQWDVPLEKNKLWEEREKGFREFAKRYGHTNAFVRSNYSAFLNWDVLDNLSPEISSWRIDTTEGIGMFGIAAPILYSKGYSLLRMAASHTWEYPWPSAANPLIDDNLVFAGKFRLMHEHFNYARADKLELIINLVKKGLIDRPLMKVCDGQNANNCRRYSCSKCIPTAFMLLALGENPRLYGLTMSDKEILEKMPKYLDAKQEYWTHWELGVLRDKLKTRGYPERIAWFMTMGHKESNDTEYLKGLKQVNWQEFKDLAPASLKIPNIPVKNWY